MLHSLKAKHVFIVILVLEVLLHWNIWTLDIMGIHAWRQTQTMTVVENFAFEDMNIFNPRINSRGDGDGIVRMEFPLMQWSFAWFYKWFGSHLTIARVLTFLISILSIWGFYQLLRTYQLSETLSSFGAWCFSWSPLLFYYSVNPLPDDLALSFAIWSLVFLKRHQQENSLRTLLAFATLLSLATAVKLPFVLFGAAYIPLFVSDLRYKRWRNTIVSSLLLLFALIPAILWYSWVVPQWQNTALIGGVSAESTFDYSRALKNVWGVFHSQLPELFINYGSVLFFILGLVAFFRTENPIKKYASELMMLVAVLCFYLYEVNMIGMEHDYYLFPFVPLIFLIVTAGLKLLFESSNKWLGAVGFLALMVLPLTAYLRVEGRWTPMGNEKPLLQHKEQLRALTPDDELIVVGNDASTHIYLYHLNKKGWTFEQNWLTAEQLVDHINRGAKYLYSNTEFVDKEESIHQLLEEPIFNEDGISVYPLRQISDS